MKICPHCKSEIPDDATNCKFCGKNVTLGNQLMKLGCIIGLLGIGLFIVILFCGGFL